MGNAAGITSRRGWRVAAAVLIAALAVVAWAGRPPAAAAGGPGTWTDLSGDTGTILTVPGLTRDALEA
jgi:hypothetical protein